MQKADLKTWANVALHARDRAALSLKRKDPIAFAYWRETEKYAMLYADVSPTQDWLTETAKLLSQGAQNLFWEAKFMEGALQYSRAKWCVIIARANGWTMDPKKTGVNLGWLMEFDSSKPEQEARVMLAPRAAIG